MPHITNKPLNFADSALHHCGSHRFKEEGEGNVLVRVALSQRPVVRGDAPPPRLVFNITCWHHASSKPHPAHGLWFGMVWFGCAAVFGHSMEEQCCRAVRCRRRASSVTLPLHRSKPVRCDTQKFEICSGDVRC